eukprot:GHRR01014768.1.p1 GENE.GHRR01014768.1~~GHRR01014768.1.p1  ORF type:complete len:294 (+),score=42.18 GHRR01014768.1:240-1121(+)
MDARTALAGTARLPPCRTWVTPPHTCVRARTICLPQPCKHAVAQVATVQTPTQASTTEDGQQHRMKQELLTWLAGTERGSNAAKQLRGQIEEAQVAVEALCPPELDYSLLEGKWLLRYTTAADVIPIVGLDSVSRQLLLPLGLPTPVRVGNIYQRFSSVERGIVENIIEFSLPLLLEEHKAPGSVFTVQASYQACSGRRISLTFEQAQLSDVKPTPALEALLAPALLPRGFLNLQLLLGLRELKLVFPFRSVQQVAQGAGVGANYLLTYLDDDMLIGRATGTAGTFIFTRTSE